MSKLLLAALALAAQPAGDAAITVLEPRFEVSDRGEVAEGTVVRADPGRGCYTWTLFVTPQQREVTVREDFRLPAPAEQWNSDDPTTLQVAPDRRSAVSTLTEDLSDGVITNGWCVAEGDPLGAYRIRVFVGTTMLHQFDFTVVPSSDTV